MTELQSPFPFFGGKVRIADEVWARFGDVQNYVEPFFGSGAVLLRRPEWHTSGIETVNDKDGYISNFWRAVTADPEQTAHYADWPVNENDLHARHAWLLARKDELVARLEGDPDYYDAKIAGYWCWGICCWIGSGWCAGNGPWHVEDGKLVNGGSGGTRWQLPRLSGSQGVNRKLPHLGDAGQGVNRKRPQLRNSGEGVHRKLSNDGLYAWFEALSTRLRRVRVCSGDWTRVTGPSVTFAHWLTSVFLDPPYSQDERADELYTVETDISAAVAQWARHNGDNPLLRIALCGYDGEHEMPPSWSVYHWKAAGGYGSQGEGRGRENAKRETVWFSPACLKGEQCRMELK